LTAALRRFVREPELLPALSSRTPPIKSVASHARELEEMFRRLLMRTPAD
jgi:hypothetical protein